MAPVAIGLGSASNKVSDSVDNVSADLANADFPLVTTVTDRTGAPIASLFDQYRLPVSFNQISPNMTNAVIAIEDKRFYQHAGVDVKSALRAALSNSSGGSTQGASTITEQYVKNFLINVVDRNDKGAQAQDQAQTLARKLREAKMAMTLDQEWSKNNILTGYLNVVAFGSGGEGPFGVGAAAAAYFGTTPDKLTVAAGGAAGRHGQQPGALQPLPAPAAGAGAAQPGAAADGREQRAVRRRRGRLPAGSAWRRAGWPEDPAQHVHRRRRLRRLLLPVRGELPQAGRIHGRPDQHRRLHDQDHARPEHQQDRQERGAEQAAHHRRRPRQHVRHRPTGHHVAPGARAGRQPRLRHRRRGGPDPDQPARRHQRPVRRGLHVQDHHDGGGPGGGQGRPELGAGQPQEPRASSTSTRATTGATR